ncbi:protein kinase domain-containing protein [Nonomuraea longicatena]|uniref:Protein kinase domain-containing protein n=1 Tax=Nonomuraea longicatena TaxID=83682 RepID=A0ABP4B0S6_9ACTN
MTQRGPLTSEDPAAIGPYELVRRIGSGGMGRVYLARSPDGAKVALKAIRRDFAADPVYRSRFHEEVSNARKVASFCTARVLDHGEHDGLLYLVTEYIDGVSLEEHLIEHGALEPSVLHSAAVGVAAALTAIHAAGLVHRDLKPANVMLSLAGPRVIDFGLARSSHMSSRHTNAGMVMGTPGWIAPEQVFEGRTSPAGDVFAWGSLVAYAGLGGHPFGEGDAYVMAARARTAPPDLRGLPAPLDRLVAAAIHPDPARRPASRQLLLELVGAADEPAAQLAATRHLTSMWNPADLPPLARRPGPASPPGSPQPSGRRESGRPPGDPGYGSQPPGGLAMPPPVAGPGPHAPQTGHAAPAGPASQGGQAGRGAQGSRGAAQGPPPSHSATGQGPLADPGASQGPPPGLGAGQGPGASQGPPPGLGVTGQGPLPGGGGAGRGPMPGAPSSGRGPSASTTGQVPLPGHSSTAQGPLPGRGARGQAPPGAAGQGLPGQAPPPGRPVKGQGPMPARGPMPAQVPPGVAGGPSGVAGGPPARRMSGCAIVLVVLVALFLLLVGLLMWLLRGPSAAGADSPVQDGRLRFTVAAAKCAKAAKGGPTRVCRLSVKVKNVGAEARVLYPGQQKLLGEDDDPHPGLRLLDASGKEVTPVRIDPDASFAGALEFEVPKSVEPQLVELHDSALSRGVRVELP